jgi:homoserine kinase
MKKDSISVFAPATVANVGCGYDTIGFALEGLGEVMTLTRREDSLLCIKEVVGADLSHDIEKNVATIAIRSLLHHLKSDVGFDVSIEKQFKPGSGLGSSASSAAAAVFAANELLDNPLDTMQLLPFALTGESYASGGCIHADNVAPALLGGIQFSRSYDPIDVFRIEPPKDLVVLIIYPDVTVKTAESKSLVPKTLPIKTARDQWGNVGALIHALHTDDMLLLKRAITDHVAEPVRKGAIPAYDKVRNIVYTSGSVGFNISGSGPSMFALFKGNEGIGNAANQITDLYHSLDINCIIHQSKVNPLGCKEV